MQRRPAIAIRHVRVSARVQDHVDRGVLPGSPGVQRDRDIAGRCPARQVEQRSPVVVAVVQDLPRLQGLYKSFEVAATYGFRRLLTDCDPT